MASHDPQPCDPEPAGEPDAVQGVEPESADANSPKEPSLAEPFLTQPESADEPAIVDLRRDDSGRPRLSVTFLLGRTPAPHEPIGDLILSATVSAELVSRLDDLAWVGFSLEVASPVRAESRGPFGTVALATTLAGEEARRLLTALAQGRGGPTLELQARRRDGTSGYWLFDFAEVLAPVLAPDPSRFVHLVTTAGGVVTDVLPTRSAVRTRGPTDPGVLLMTKNVALPLVHVVRPKPVPLIDKSVVLPSHILVTEELLGLHLEAPVSGPVLGGGPLLGDRSGNQRWYLPEASLVVPAAGADAETSPFRFDLATAGHQPDGTPGLEATVTLTLALGPSQATLLAWEQAGKPPLRPLPCQPVVGLRIPFRDDQGQPRTETVAASSLETIGVLGEQGSQLKVSFRLANSWARLAYGALSTPGFQATAPSLQVTLAHDGWQAESVLSQHLVNLVATNKVVALRQAGDVTRSLSRSQVTSLAKSKLQLKPAISPLEKVKAGVTSWSWVRRNPVSEVATVLPCAEHGQLYRQARADGWDAIGCQPALQLGQSEYRTWQAETVTSVTGVRVFRSLTQPGRFLVVPERYQVGRHAADDPQRALQPTLLLTSTIDTDNPANILCVLAAALEPETNAAQYALLAEELRQRTGREVDLLSPAQAGLNPAVSWAIPQVNSLDCLAVETGFTIVVSTGVPGFLALKSLLQLGSVVGSARYRLPGGIEFASTLKLDLGNVVGPLAGAVVAADGGNKVTLTNQLKRQVAVHRVVGNGVVVASPGLLLDAGASSSIAHPDGAAGPFTVDYTVAPGTETLDEARSYIEDLQLGVTFIATGSFSGLAGLEVACQFLGRDDEVFSLTETQRSREREFILPLTAYATDPAVVFTVTAVATDGTRTSSAAVSWPVRSQGVLIPLDRPAPGT
ncbi:hypothetical protein [Aestuariimicrobium sp. Y1814]|uniref:hypothetical protein n=1 Tax=Aestuariimicrobium sp. Y1814 TaxID=3418742 RepID=UPI003DA75AB0